MYWDQALPAVVGYIAALLYNQNNVAAEASPATTPDIGENIRNRTTFRTHQL
jgi:hypothetical protein